MFFFLLKKRDQALVFYYYYFFIKSWKLRQNLLKKKNANIRGGPRTYVRTHGILTQSVPTVRGFSLYTVYSSGKSKTHEQELMVVNMLQ